MEDKRLKNIENQIEKLAAMTAKGFADVDKKFEQLEDKMDNRFDGVNNRIDDLADTRTRTDVVEGIDARVTSLEKEVFDRS